MIKEAILKVVSGSDLTYDESKQVMEEMMTGTATQAQMASFLTALRMKGETIDEITACAEVMRSKALHVKHDTDVMDIVGTGGDGTGTFNVSTTASFVIAAAGIPVAKHGNRSMSSKSGSADCLEQLGVNITITPEQSEKVLKETNLCFMFAQGYHKSMKYVAPVRREIGIRNIFNILGPLTNPANANMQVMGVFTKELCKPLAQVLINLGVKKGMVVYGLDGIDEATVTDKTYCCEIKGGEIKDYYITPEEMGLKRYSVDELLGGDGKENAQIAIGILKGETVGAKRDAVLLNAGIALYVAGKADSIKAGVELAGKIIDEGKAFSKKEEFVALTNE